MSTTTIRKALISSFGAIDDVSNISVVSASLPAPSKSQLQVRVLYAGFGGADVHMRLGSYPLQRKAPLTPGYTLVGRVVGLGGSCRKFQTGDIVAAATTYDAQAELANIPESLAVRVPAELATSDALLRQVMGLVMDWNTALGMVERAADVRAGQKVFVHGLSGAVGHGTMMLCLLRGAKVYGTAARGNHAALALAGATPFEYTNKDWIKAMQAEGGADAVFDPLGFESLDESWSILSLTGILVGYGGNQGVLTGDGKPRSPFAAIAKLLARRLLPGSKRSTWYYINPSGSNFKEDLARLMEMRSEGKIEVSVRAVWDFDTDGLREAHRSWGKVSGLGSQMVRVAGDQI